MIKIGDRIKVIDQEIYGIVIHDYGTEITIEDEDADLFNCLEDKLLCFKKSEVEEIKQWQNIIVKVEVS